MLGIFCAAVLSNVVTVYVFHDVDADKIGHWNEAFAGLFIESVLFALIVCGGVAVLTFLGRRLFQLKGFYPRAKLGLYVGIGVAIFQYAWDFAGRTAFPTHGDTGLTLYLILAIIGCSIVFVRDSLMQQRLSPGSGASHDG